MPFQGSDDPLDDPFYSAPIRIWRYTGAQSELNRDGNGVGKRGIIGPSAAAAAVPQFSRTRVI